jgi:polyether ionophore transport system permease protein
MTASTVTRAADHLTLARTTPTSPAPALVRRAFLDARTRTIVFAYIFAVYAWIQAKGYHSAYPTLADRELFARTFAGNDAIRLFYGYPYDVVTIGGYSAWRVGGTLALAAAAYGVFAAVRAIRSEEESGRTEIVLAGGVSRRLLFASSMVAIAMGAAVLWLAEFAGFVFAGLPAAGSAYLSLSTTSIIVVFVGTGALVSQLASSRRTALTVGIGGAALFWLLRVVSDIVTGASWLRWTTPLGWAEELRPFAGPRPVVLLIPGASALVLLLAAARISRTRDVGTGLIPANDAARPSFRLLSSPTAQVLRRQRGVLSAWIIGVAGFAAVLGAISTSISGAGISSNLKRDFAKFGSGSIVTPVGYLSFVLIVFVFAISLFACSQVGSARQEEADEQLETLLAQPLSRYRWLGGRLLLGAAAIAFLSLLAGLLTWAGSSSQGVAVSLPEMLEAGANCLPISLMVLGLAALIYSVLPRVSSTVSYTLVTLMFLWYLVGSLLRVPDWLIDATPFRHIGLVPAQNFQLEAALVMVAVGLAAGAIALGLFRRRDLTGA